MKNLVSTSLILIGIGRIAFALPTGSNSNAVNRRDNSAGLAQLPPWLVAYLTGGLNSGDKADSGVLQPAAGPAQVTHISAGPPASGVNIGGSGGKPGSITTSVPATSGGETLTVPAGASISVTGENGSVSTGGGSPGNGGSIIVTAGKEVGDSTSSTDDDDHSDSDGGDADSDDADSETT